MKKHRKLLSLTVASVLAITLIFGLRLVDDAHLARAQGSCPVVQNTPKFTHAYGNVTINGQVAPVGTVVDGRNATGDVVGCRTVTNQGNYGALRLHGEDDTVTPSIPGMQDSETVQFYVDGVQAATNLSLLWTNDKDIHEIDLNMDILGDVNCDGGLNIIDVIYMFQYTSLLRTLSSTCPASPVDGTLYGPSCDTNADTNCNIIDVILAFQCTSLIPNVLCP